MTPLPWRRLPRTRLIGTLCVLPLLTLVALAGCGDDDDDGDGGGGDTAVSYAGPFASSASAGVIRFGSTAALVADGRAALVAPIDVTGTMTFTDGTVVNLSGTLDETVLALTGSGYSFSGTAVSANVISGTFTGPGGESGTFSATLTSDGAAVTVLCGEFSGDDSGAFSLGLLPDRTGGAIVGDQTGRARPKSGTSNQVEILPDALPSFVVATGTLSGDGQSISGTWQDPTGSSGSFAGSAAACSGGSNGTSFFGFFLGDSRINGGLRLDFATPPTGSNATALVTGSVITPVSGSPIALTGTAQSDGGFTASGGGYTLTGVVEGELIYGNWGPPGSFSVGSFAAASNGAGTPLAFCGRYAPTGTNPPPAGNFDVLVFGSAVAGGFRADPADSPIYGTFTTTASGGAYAYSSTGSGFSYNVTNGVYSTTATSGSLNWTGQGIFNAGNFTVVGTYSGTRCPGT